MLIKGNLKSNIKNQKEDIEITGNVVSNISVSATGNITVFGNVKENVCIKTKGDITVMGNVAESAELISTAGKVTIAGASFPNDNPVNRTIHADVISTVGRQTGFFGRNNTRSTPGSSTYNFTGGVFGAIGTGASSTIHIGNGGISMYSSVPKSDDEDNKPHTTTYCFK